MSYKEWFEENKKDLVDEYLDSFTHCELKYWIIETYQCEFIDEHYKDFEKYCMDCYDTEQTDLAYKDTLRS